LRRYEGMFLFDNTNVRHWPEVEAEVRRLCDRIQANLQVCLKFDERKLAYEIKGRKRGTYVLTYFEAEPNRIADLERDARLSELILRTLVIRADHISDARLAELQALPPEQPLQPSSGEGRRGEGGPPRERREPSTEGGARAGASEGSAREKETITEPKAAPQRAPEESPDTETPESKLAEE
jgi:small subunit ribosomal protein S6